MPGAARQLRFNEHLAAYARQLEPGVLADGMAHALLAGGKRLRPLLVLLWAERFGADAEDALDAALALELVHTYSLVHDDLPCMDDDKLRRGKPTVHVVYGEANALLVGDALLTDAFGQLAGLSRTGARRTLAALVELSAAAGARGMVNGQLLDLAGQADTVEAVRAVHRAKTGALLAACCAVGAQLGDASEEAVARARRYGAHLGAAFQAQDDLLDVEGQTDVLGKPTGSDEQRALPTLVGLLGASGCRALVEEDSAAALALLNPQQAIEQELAELTRWLVGRDR
jgi:geranylgeranyl diphosphate synthase type II